MPDAQTRRLSTAEIQKLDPYQLMGELGKSVIHPGGRRSTEQLIELAGLEPGLRVLEIGCGVGTTAIDIAQRFGCTIDAVDIDENMLTKANRNVVTAGLGDRITVDKADIQQLPAGDDEYDRVLIEAVTMFVVRERAAAEVVRVCKPGGRVIDHEFIWTTAPPPEARRVFEGEICPGIKFDSEEDWTDLYRSAGLDDFETTSGPFVMMTPRGFLQDEGAFGTARIFLRSMTRLAYMRKMAWMMPRVMKALPYLGYVVLAGTKPAIASSA